MHVYVWLSPFSVHLKLSQNCWVSVKNPPSNAEDADAGSIPGSERSPGEENGNPLQYSCLEKSMDREAWPATVHGVTKESDTTL